MRQTIFNNLTVGDGNGNVEGGSGQIVEGANVAGGPDEAGARRIESELNAGTLSAEYLIKGAEVRPLSRTAERLANVAKTRNAAKSVLSAIGRTFMGLAHAIKSLLSGDVLRSSWRQNNVANFDLRLKTNPPPGASNLAEMLPLLKDNEGHELPTIAFDKEVVAIGTGFPVKIDAKTGKTNVTVVPFKDELFPNGRPRLSDVKQNPDLQDCWFLSGIASILAAKGPEAIERLIRMREDDEGNKVCDVRLGRRVFTVPFGEVRCNGKCCTSDSAPWVKILEQAAAMYCGSEEHVRPIATSNDLNALLKSQTDIIFRPGELAQEMLSGGVRGVLVTVGNLDMLQYALEHGIPVQLGHNPSGLGHIPGALRDNISPGHMVSLLHIHPRGNGKAWLTVMDPYGHTRIISSSALKRCMAVYGCSQKEYDNALQAFRRKNASKAPPKERAEVLLHDVPKETIPPLTRTSFDIFLSILNLSNSIDQNVFDGLDSLTQEEGTVPEDDKAVIHGLLAGLGLDSDVAKKFEADLVELLKFSRVSVAMSSGKAPTYKALLNSDEHKTMNIRKELTLNSTLATKCEELKVLAGRDGASQQLKDLVGFLDELPRWDGVRQTGVSPQGGLMEHS